jgi:glutamate synthase domain-containing protein 2
MWTMRTVTKKAPRAKKPAALTVPASKANGSVAETQRQLRAPDPDYLRPSASFPPRVIAEIQRAAREGIYEIRGLGTKRALPSFDDLVLLGASISRYPLEGYREKCATDVVIGSRFAKTPLHLKIPITIAGMSFGSLSATAKEALGRAATAMGTSTTTGDGGMTEEERRASKMLVYQVLPSRYGLNPDDLRRADAIEVVVGQGAKPGGGGMLLGQKITERVAKMRTLPAGIDQRSACRHPDWTGPDDLEIKIEELREITDWRVPIYVKIAAARPRFDVALAVKAGADAIVLDGMQGGTGATQDVFIEHVGIPTLPALREAVESLQELDMHRKVQLIVSGGIRSGADVAKALAMGADAVSIGSAALVALNCNRPIHVEDYRALGTEPGYCHHCHTGRCPVGVATQDPALEKRLNVEAAARQVRNYLSTMVLEAQTLARACGKSHVLNLEPEDLVALNVEAAAMAGVPLAGTKWIPGREKPRT